MSDKDDKVDIRELTLISYGGSISYGGTVGNKKIKRYSPKRRLLLILPFGLKHRKNYGKIQRFTRILSSGG